ncbi:MAG: hypothetical protein M3P18_15070 [Actinomycetota bacterium]|nr:hypothetical protein [Actinomycetota bacterium]
MNAQKTDRVEGVVTRVTQAKTLVQAVPVFIGAAAAVVAFIRTHGAENILMEIGTMGIAFYIAGFCSGFIVAPFLALLERITRRESTDTALFVGLGFVTLVGGILVRIAFGGGVNHGLDATGRAFMVSLGIVVLLIPVLVVAVVAWYTKGSKVASRESK